MPGSLPTQVPLSQLPPVAWVAIGVIGVFALVLVVIALLDLYRRPVEQVTGGRKWLWLIVILFLNSGIGAIIYLLAGRKAAAAVETAPAAPVADRADTALDALYGRPEDGDKA